MTEEIMDCPEPDCDGHMVLRHSHKYNGPFYGCSNFPDCRSTHGAHADGRPLGIPATKFTKQCRIRAHEAFDKLWEKAPDFYDLPSLKMNNSKARRMYKGIQRIARSRAYKWLEIKLGLADGECHIGMFDADTCARAIEICDGIEPPTIRQWAKETGHER